MPAPLRSAVAPLAALLLSACVQLIPQGGGPRPAPRPVPVPTQPAVQNAAQLALRAGPPASGLGMAQGNAAAALSAFIASCPRLTRRTDNSGLTRPEDWQTACTAAPSWPRGDAKGFFARYFETVVVGEGRAFVTGYYEPEIAGSRTRRPGFEVPVYGLPTDLVRALPGDAPPNDDGKQPLGRYDASGRFVPFYTRAEIDDGALAGRGLEIAWAADPVEFFFLQIQGSGRLRTPEGTVIRVGFAGQNGWPYTGIGSIMRERGLIGSGPGQYPGSMQGMMRYLRENPADGRALMEQNRSFIFFREVTGTTDAQGPVGALGIPVSGRTTVAADPAFVPLGAPVWLDLDRAEADGLWVAQDTGGAIKGANRFDSFWGAGEEARRIAGGMSGNGTALVLLPRGTLARLGTR